MGLVTVLEYDPSSWSSDNYRTSISHAADAVGEFTKDIVLGEIESDSCCSLHIYHSGISVQYEGEISGAAIVTFMIRLQERVSKAKKLAAPSESAPYIKVQTKEELDTAIGENEMAVIGVFDESAGSLYKNVFAMLSSKITASATKNAATTTVCILVTNPTILKPEEIKVEIDPHKCPAGTWVYHSGSHCCKADKDRDGRPLTYHSITCSGNSYVECPAGAEDGNCKQ